MSRNLPVLLFASLISLGICQPVNASAYDPASMGPQQSDPAFPPAFHELLIPSHGALLSGFMLNNYSGAKLLAEIQENAAAFDVRNLAESFGGRSVLLITGTEDSDVPPAVQARIVAAYEKIPDINLDAELIPGDHAFSVSRIRLQRMVIEWLDGNCR